MSLINDLRLDVGDDSSVVYPTGSVITAQPTINACASTYLLLTDLRLDIGDDADVDFGIVNRRFQSQRLQKFGELQ